MQAMPKTIVQCRGCREAQPDTDFSWSSEQTLSPCHALPTVQFSHGGCGGLVCRRRRSDGGERGSKEANGY